MGTNRVFVWLIVCGQVGPKKKATESKDFFIMT